ncbi:MAG: helix-turn-helix transcriptional regulator [Planctomycetes bacterium]|nr:helix-turn-helix transcriptional regulator [Planctomycetota bacterium]
MLLMLGRHSLDLDHCGHVAFSEQRWTNSAHRHPEYQELCWVIAGSGYFYHGDQRFELSPGSCFISELNVQHEIASPELKDLELFFITLSKSAAQSAIDHDAHSIWRSYTEEHQIHCHIPDIQNYWQLIEQAPHQLRRDHLLRALTLESLSALAISPSAQSEVASSDPSKLAMSYIRRHARQAPSVQEISQTVGLSERQLRRRFQQSYGCGIVDAINRCRLEEARHLLLMHNSVSATAEAVGIASPAMFSRLFKEAFGCTPSAWRKQHVQQSSTTRTIFGKD